MADATSSYQQLHTIAGLVRTTTMPDLNVDNPSNVDAKITTRLQNADRQYPLEVVTSIAQQPGWEPEPVVGSPGSSVPGTAALW